jgi:membrane-associated HD superfamily phosphohydrolase
MRRPQYFVENQYEGNIHDTLAPTLSTIAITAHVKEGLELARQYHLPPVIRDAIVQHHGTCLVSFFYHQATGGDIKDQHLEQQFRYEGPKPQSREMAILMLADSVEAVARTLEKPTPQKIEQIIDVIIQAKLKDGQFDECDLTFRDIGGIKAAFVRTVVSMLHSRIEYPNVIVAEPNPPLPPPAQAAQVAPATVPAPTEASPSAPLVRGPEIASASSGASSATKSARSASGSARS